MVSILLSGQQELMDNALLCMWTSDGVLAWEEGKKFDTALVRAAFRDFNMHQFYKPNIDARWCRDGGCHACVRIF